DGGLTRPAAADDQFHAAAEAERAAGGVARDGDVGQCRRGPAVADVLEVAAAGRKLQGEAAAAVLGGVARDGDGVRGEARRPGGGAAVGGGVAAARAARGVAIDGGIADRDRGCAGAGVGDAAAVEAGADAAAVAEAADGPVPIDDVAGERGGGRAGR